MTIERLARWIIIVWSAGGNAIGVFALLNIPILALFAAHRVRQLRDPEFDLRVTTPSHGLLHYFCAAVYGIIFPAFYFLSVRTRHSLGAWQLGPDTNSVWTIALGALCMGWLLVRMFQPGLSLDRIRFQRTPVNWLFSSLAIALCLWFHYHALAHAETYLGRAIGDPFDGFYMTLIFPQTCFLGATLVYGFALLESRRRLATPALLVRSRWAYVLGPLGIAAVFAPFWLSIPRVTHGQAIDLLKTHHDDIVLYSKQAGLDPSLLAGVIYVAHTRDHPRWTGELLERIQIESSVPNLFGALFAEGPPIDFSMGVAQMRPHTLDSTLEISMRVIGRWRPFDIPDPLIPFRLKGLDVDPLMLSAIQTMWNERPSTFRYNWQAGKLLDHKANLTCAIAMLAVFRQQWREAGFPIDARPEILATLYNIGYERSKPKADPKANDFGRRVMKFMESEQAKKLFGEEALHER